MGDLADDNMRLELERVVAVLFSFLSGRSGVVREGLYLVMKPR
jgi:hypothetical protein